MIRTAKNSSKNKLLTSLRAAEILEGTEEVTQPLKVNNPITIKIGMRADAIIFLILMNCCICGLSR